MLSRHILSKSSYIRSLQCHKSLYLYKHHYKLRDPVPPALQARYQLGHDIGHMAQRLFPGGIDCSARQPWNYGPSLSQTARLISEGCPVIYEAAFQFDGVLAVTDLLLQRGGKSYAYEVKSAESISDTYLEDAALQYYVIVNSKTLKDFPLGDFFILHLNRPLDEALQGDPAEIFAERSVLEYCRDRLPDVEERVNAARDVIASNCIPGIETGPHCMTPYKCDFYGYCHR